MAKPRLRFNFARYSNDALDNKAAEIIQKMTNNSNFVTPAPPLADVQAALTMYQQSLALGSRLNAEQASIKKERCTSLEAHLKKLAFYVENIASDNEPMLLSAGFDLVKPAAPVGTLSKPEAVKLEEGIVPGSLKATVTKVLRASSYMFEITPMPVTAASIWQVNTSTSRTFQFSNLESLKEYAVRVAGVGSDPVRVYSDVISRWVI